MPICCSSTTTSCFKFFITLQQQLHLIIRQQILCMLLFTRFSCFETVCQIETSIFDVCVCVCEYKTHIRLREEIKSRGNHLTHLLSMTFSIPSPSPSCFPTAQLFSNRIISCSPTADAYLLRFYWINRQSCLADNGRRHTRVDLRLFPFRTSFLSRLSVSRLSSGLVLLA